MEDTNKIILERANYLIDRYKKLNIIYIRVSTDKKGQQEEDQIPEILNFFHLNIKECLVISEKKSGFKIESQKNREIVEILKLIQELENKVEKNIFFWSIDRIYRNRKLTEQFYDIATKHNTGVYSVLEYFINDFAEIQKKLPEDMGWLIEQQQKTLINFFGWMAELESKKIGRRVKKSYKLDEETNRYYTNQGRLVGRKMKTIEGKMIEDIDIIIKIKNGVVKCIQKNLSYEKIIDLAAKKMNVKLSRGYIWKIKQELKNKKNE